MPAKRVSCCQSLYPDLMLCSSEKLYDAHQVIVCLRSNVIARACEAQRAAQDEKADSTSDSSHHDRTPPPDPSDENEETSYLTFDFKDDEPEAVDCLVQYCYHLDYGIPRPFREVRDWRGEEIKELAIPPPEGRDMILHAVVYALADKYDVPGLKILSRVKFEEAVARHWDGDFFADAVYEAYTTTEHQDRGLRDIVVATITEHDDALLKDLRIGNLMREVQGLFRDLTDSVKRSPRY